MKRVDFLLLAGCLTSCAFLPFITHAEPADFSQWENDMRAFEAADKENPPPKGAVLFIGSSSIRGWNTLRTDFPEYQVINRGFGGSTIADSTHFADRIVIPYQPSHILLYAGDNDINAGLSPEEVAKDFKAFVARVHASLPETRIGFIAMKPSPNRAHLIEAMRTGNKLISEYARSTRKVDYIDIFEPMLDANGDFRKELFAEDELHLNAKGYQLWTKIVAPYLKRVQPTE